MVAKDKKFPVFANIILMLLTLAVILPLLLLISSSITSDSVLIREGYSFFPREIDFSAYQVLAGKGTTSILNAYKISFFVTFVGTIAGLTITVMFAYPLSRKTLPGRNFFSFFLFFTMLFNGGLVPSYIMWTQTFHIRNTIWALLIPNLLMSAFNVIMMRTYFTSNIPEEVIDAARIDGAGEVRILTKIVLPMSKPILTTVGLFIALGYWNDWINGLYYINNDNLYGIQVLLNRMLLNAESMKKASSTASVVAESMPSISLKMAVAVLGMLPVLLIYPFFQKYFVKGITVGSVKG
ncbi:MAG: carbohydrate ABC transporter permease [Dorea sp.]